MEEILSSIKKIIADDDRAKAGSVRRSGKVAPSAKPEAIEDVYDDEHVLELTQAENEPVPANNNQDTEADLLDTQKAQSLRHSFSTLQTLADPGVPPQIVRSGETSLEGLVREMLKPMLKDWLDDNLPNLVESMVEREIARITKKG